MFLVSELLGLLMFAGICAVGYRYRNEIKRWITDREYGRTWEVDALTRASRDVTKAEWKLEDAKAHKTYEEKRAK